MRDRVSPSHPEPAAVAGDLYVEKKSAGVAWPS